jgi:L-serine deaminase
MNIFDVIGPVMIGPSSSHTAGEPYVYRYWQSAFWGPGR